MQKPYWEDELLLEQSLSRYLPPRQPRPEFISTLGQKLAERPQLTVTNRTRYQKALWVSLVGLVTGVVIVWLLKRKL